MWSEYRHIKLKLLILLFGWIPFGIILGAMLPLLFHSYVPSYALAVSYIVLLAYTALRYALYPCPNCGLSLRGRQFYRRTCPRCGTPINKGSG